MNYIKITKLDVADGPGCRVTLWVSGCRNHCPGCHNKESWDFNAGKEFDTKVFEELCSYLARPYIKGLTICGGEPLDIHNQGAVLGLLYTVKKRFPDKDIWCYTGYWFEDLLEGGKANIVVSTVRDLLPMIDVLIDGPFVLEKRNITDNNRWRGSTNQRVIDVKKSLAVGHAVPLDGIPNNNF